MPSTYTPNNGITLQANGENNLIWGTMVNNEAFSLIDTSLDGVVTLALTGATSSLAITDGAASDGRNRILLCTGALAANHTITVTPNDAEKWYFVQNNTTGGYSVLIGQGGGAGTTVTVPYGYTKLVRIDGTGTNANATEVMPSPAFGGSMAVAGAVAVTGALSVTGAATFNTDASINGVELGRGGGSVASNTAVGNTALAANTVGTGNTAFGGFTFYQLTGGAQNTGVGYAAGFQNTGGSNTAIGYTALNASSSGSGNTAVGNTALIACTGSQNTAIGNQAGLSITSGTGNVVIGGNSGSTIATATNNIILSDGGANIRAHADSGGRWGLGTSSTASSGLRVAANATDWTNAAMGASIVADGSRNNAVVALNSASANPVCMANINSGLLLSALMPALGSTATGPRYDIFIDRTNGYLGLGGVVPASSPIQAASGATLSVGGTWTNASDVALKHRFEPVTPARILDAVAALAVSKWEYLAEPGVEHIGPTAQDFKAAFGIGGSDKGISTVDAIGVLMAAVQALAGQVRGMQRPWWQRLWESVTST